MVVGDKFYIYDSVIRNDKETGDYWYKTRKDFGVHSGTISPASPYYETVKRLFDNGNFDSVKLYRDVEDWIVLPSETLVIDKHGDTYVKTIVYKISNEMSDAYSHPVILYIKFNKSLITEICDISGLTKEQACALIQVFVLSDFIGDSFKKMLYGFKADDRRSVLASVIGCINTDESIVCKVSDCIYHYMTEAMNIERIIRNICYKEVSLRNQFKFSSIDFFCSEKDSRFFIEKIQKDVEERTFDRSDYSFANFEESDDLIYTDDVDKILKEKGWDKYVSRNDLAITQEQLQTRLEGTFEYSTDSVNITGLSNFGNKLSRIL